MPNIKESFRSARKRINSEGLMFSGAVTAISPAIIPTVGAGVTFAVHEIEKDADTALVRILTVGVLGLLNAASVATETKALRDHNYSASPLSSTLNVLTGKPLLSSLGGHLVNYAQLSALNPINIFSVATKNSELLLQSETALSLTLTAWFISLNSLVLQGKTQPFVEGVGKVRQAIRKRLKK